MEGFTYRSGILHAEEVSAVDLAETYGTPLYVYSRGYLRHQFRRVREAFAEIDPLICFAVKANTSAAVIHTFAAEGAGADVVSGGELFRARRAGIPADRIVFAGVGKTAEEIEYAIREEILGFTVESEAELHRISECAVRIGGTARVDIRVNPDVDPKTHKYTSTGKKENKFGVDLERAVKAYELAARLPGIEIVGLHMHIGSPVMSIDPYVEALERIAPVVRELKAAYPTLRHLDIGGGLGIRYRDEQEDLDPVHLAKALVPTLKELDLKVLLEPGRFLTGNAGILLTRVQYLKEGPEKTFVIMDAAMNDLIRPALYEAYHKILPVRETEETLLGDLVGPVCESGDFFAQNRELPAVQAGELLAVMSAGAYGYVMASNYNSRGRPAEVMVSGGTAKLVQRRETWDDLVAGETVPAWE